MINTSTLVGVGTPALALSAHVYDGADNDSQAEDNARSLGDILANSFGC